MSFNININPSEVLQERTVPREGCPGGRRAWRERPAAGGPSRHHPGTPGRAGLEPGQQQRQGQQGQQTRVQGGGRAPQRGLVGLGGRRALGAGQAAPGAAQLLQVPLELDLAGLLAQRLPDGGRFHGASRQHRAGAGVEIIPGPGGEGGSRGRCWRQVTPPSSGSHRDTHLQMVSSSCSSSPPSSCCCCCRTLWAMLSPRLMRQSAKPL